MSPSRARALLDRLEARGIRLWLDGQRRLRFRAPTGALTADLRAEIGALKPALLTLLAGRAEPPASGPIRRGEGDRAPVSFAQRRLWFLSQLEGGAAVYNIPGAWRLRGPLDAERLRVALRRLEIRHEMLRTTFALVDGEPHQRIGPPRVALEVVDLSDRPPAERAREVARLTDRAAQQTFDLSAGPLWAPLLVRLAATEHVFSLTLHHIVADGWSLSVLLAELVRFYREPDAALPALPVRYADFALWQREWLEGPEPAEHLRWWTAQLADAPRLLELPTDHPRPPVQRDRGAHLAFTLPAGLGDALDALARSRGATLFMVLETAFALLLSRYSGQTDVLVGTPVANRQHTAVEPLVGLFLNALVIRNDLGGAPTFAEALARTRAAALDAFERQALPFEVLVETLRPERSLAHSPVFQVMFNLLNTDSDDWALPGVSVERLDVDYPVAKHDVILTMQSRHGILHGLFEYSTDLFEAATIERMVGHYRTLLDAIVADPERPVATLPLLTDGERRRMLVEWNGHTAPRPEVPWHVLFTRQVGRTPDAPAIVDRHACRQRTLTYREVHRRAHRLAGRLRRAGVGVDAVVGVSLPRSAETLIAMAAIFAAGGAYMPLEPTLPTARLRDMAARAGAAAIIARPADHGRFEGFEVVEPFEVDVIRYDSHVIANDMDATADAMGRLAYVLFTSGSTGRPKAVMVEQRGLINNLYAKIEDHEMGPEARLAQTAPVSFDISVWQFLAAPLVGGVVRVFDDDLARDPARFVERVEAEGITHIEVVPSFFRFVLDALDGPDAPRLDRLRWVSLTGEALPPALLGPWFARFPDIPILNAYGPAECSDDATHHVLRGPLPDGTAAVPIGRAIPNVRLYVLDGARQPVPVGVPGELYVGGVGVGRGYLGDPAQTAERFVDDPFDPSPGARMYRTGDGVRALADGTLVFLGRLDHQVKLRGVRIELGEIEATLAAHPTVHEALAEVREVDGEQHLVAWLTLTDAAGADDGARAEARIEQWSALHDESHRDVRLLDGDPTLDVHGWDSMYDNRPLPAASMRQYIDAAVARALAHAPRRVLEIGCGTGLLAFRLIPRVERYLGVDISPVIVERLRARAAEPAVRARVAGLDGARFEVARADGLGHLPAGGFDLVMLPSMVQYLPGGAHLEAVIEGLIDKVADGGVVFVGDVRHRGLLPAFHASLQVFRAPDDDRDALRDRALSSLHAEAELAVDPRLFTRLARRIPRITHVEVLPERGPLHDEMIRFRYDVRLHVGGPAPATVEAEWLDWAGQDLDAIEGMLSHRDDFGLRRVANARLSAALADLHRLELTPEAPPGGAIDPGDLWALAERTGHRLHLSLAAGHADGAFDALFTRTDGPVALPHADERGAARLTTDPTLRARAQALDDGWRRFLAERLPAYMVPAHIIALDALPLTPNGKVDRRRLPPPVARASAGPADDRPPTATEAALLDIWREVLPVEHAGLHSDFFDCGGHSLLATVLVSRVRKALDVELPLRQVFDTPTIAGLARAVDALTHRGAALPPLVAGPRPETLPLSFAQQRLWFLDALQGPSAQYSLPNALRLRGSLDPDRVEAAFAAIEAHHEALRTTIHTVDGQAVQRVGPPRFRLHRRDLGARAPAERAAALARIVEAESARVFDLAAGPLWRVTLVRLAADEHVLVVVMHHIISDGWSMGVLSDAFAALYRDPEAALPPLPVQYADYALWQRRWLAGEARRRLLDHWTARLADAPTLSAPPPDRARPAQQSDAGDRLVRALDPAAVERLGARARTRDATPFMALEALFAVLIGRWAGQDDVCIGTPLAGRQVTEVEGLIGLFVNPLVLRNDLSGDPSFDELLVRVREAALAAYAHQALPFEALVDGLALERSLSHSPLFQALFALQNEPRRPLDLPGLFVEAVETPPKTARFDLSLIVQPLPDGWRAEWSWRTALYDRATVERLADGFDRLLAAAADSPGTAIGRLPLLAEAERRDLLARWSGAADAVPAPGDTVVHRLFAHAARSPDAPAVVDADRRLTYRALAERVERLAHRLARRGVGPDAVVGLHLARSVDMIVGLLGIMRAGGACLPLDPSLPAERLAAMLSDAGVRLVVAGGATAFDGFDDIRVIELPDETYTIDGTHDLPEMPSPSHLAYVIFTSGSTGRPKGVAVEHGNLMAYVDGVVPAIGLRPGATFATVSTLAADLGHTAIFPALCTGGAVLVPDDEAITDPERFARLARRRGMHALKITPTHLRALLSGPDPAGVVPTELLVLGGEACDRALVDAVRRLRPECRIVNHYGPTETTVGVLTHAIGDGSDRPVPLGRPLPGAVVHVLDRHGEPVPIGVPGELCVGGAQVTRGYIGRPDLTAERFVTGPDGRRVYRTGDRCRWILDPDGGPPRVEFFGRVDAQVKIRGFRVEPGEVEACLGRLPAVEAAAVVVDRSGPSARLIAHVVGEGARDVAAVKAGLSATLPDYMVPARIVWRPALPRNANGKIDRRALAAEPLPEPAAAPSRRAPPTATEAALAEIWCAVLGLDAVGITDDFFHIGGDSIVSIRIVSRARAAGLSLTARQLFEHRTIAELARLAEQPMSRADERAATVGPVPLLPGQRRFVASGWSNPDHYNVPLRIRLAPGIDAGAIEAALEAVVAAHDVFRLRVAADGQARLVADAPEVPLAVVEASGPEDPAATRAAADGHRGLSIADGPLSRAVLIRRPGGEDELSWVLHHLAVDGFSCRILLDDLAQALTQIADGQPPRLPSTGLDFAAWARRVAARYPAQALPGEARAPVPVDHVSGPDDIRSQSRISRRLDRASTRALLEAPARSGARVDSTLLAALALAWRAWTGRSDLRVELESHGRGAGEVDLSRTVGWLAGGFAFDLALPPVGGAREALRAIDARRRAVGEDAPLRGVAAPGPAVHFNYIGQFTAGDREGPVRGLIDEDDGVPAESPDGPRPWLIDVTAAVFDGRLDVHWFYGRNRHRRETIEALADAWLAALDGLLSDVGDAVAPEADGAAVEDRYPLSPSQAGMLVETLAAPGSARHVEQSIFTWRGPLDRAAFTYAWRAVQARHPVLRTGFDWGGGQPTQYVLREAPVAIEWRTVDPADPEAIDRLAAAERQRGFDPSAPPLFRLAVFDADASTHHIVWTRHHILTDGWSFPIIVRELMALYRARLADRPAGLPPARPYRAYIEWLAARDRHEAEAFWRGQLAGFETPTPVGRATPRGDASGYGYVDHALDAAASAALVTAARGAGLTPNTLARAAWARVLARHGGARDVVFGATVSGRPPDLPGVESMVGVFINTVPVRIDAASTAPLGDWLAAVQRQAMAAAAHTGCAAGQIHGWSGMPRGRSLYDSVLVFENYPVGAAPAEDDIALVDGRAVGAHTRHALTALVVPGEVLRLRLVYDRARLDAATADALIARFAALLEALTDGVRRGDPRPVAEVVARAEREPLPRADRPPSAETTAPVAAEDETPPRTPTERALADIWRAVLGVPVASVRADLFDLGGHSLVALRLIAQIEQRLGVRLGFADILQHATIERLAARVERPETRPASSTVVTLSAGGPRRPLFCLPGGGGNVVYLHALARRLPDRPFHALQAVGLEGEAPPHATVEAAAARYIADMRAVQPEGPYLLAGHSFGGRVAFEMARQLRADGVAVARLVLLDSTVPTPRADAPIDAWDDGRWARALVETFAAMSGRPPGPSADALPDLTGPALAHRLRDALVELALLPPGADPRFARGWLAVFRADMRSRYAPPPGLDVPVTLLRATEWLARDARVTGDVDDRRHTRTLGWDRLVDGIEVIDVPGDHITMMASPHVQVLAERLTACLERES